MKKFISIIIVAFLAVSCSKSSSGYLPSSSNDPTAKRQEIVKVRLISDWQNISLRSVNVNGANQLYGESTLTQVISYETGMHKKLAYVKFRGREEAIYKPLPMSYPTQIGNHAFDFILDFSTFKIFISNPEHPGRLVVPEDFSGFQYRYIIIPTEIYLGTQVDWNDLPAVAAALNFSL